MAESTEHSPEELTSALRTVMGFQQPPPAEPEAAPAPVTTSAEEEPVQPENSEPQHSEPESQQAGEPEAEPQAAEEPQESPELAALRAELAETRKRASQGLDAVRGGYIRKATEANRLRDVLKRAAEGGELTREEIARVLAENPEPAPGQMPAQPIQPPAAVDEGAIGALVQWQMENGLSEAKLKAFLDWVNGPESTITQRDIIQGDPYTTMQLGYAKYQSAQRVTPVQAKAIASLARTQRQVAKSAAGAAASGRSSPAPKPPPLDPNKMGADDMEKAGLPDIWLKQILSEAGVGG